MSFTIAIVGRPNVGKSTLFNRLIGQRKSITDDLSGVTRDRIYGECDWNGKKFNVIDTGGFVPDSDDVFEKAIAEQVLIAMEEASLILFMVDVATGVTDLDDRMASLLRRSEKKVFVVVNKVDNTQRSYAANEFYSLGIDPVFFLSSINGSGSGELLDAITDEIPQSNEDLDENIPKISIIGQPNVGKSSITNALLGEERNIVTNIAGTTRDSIHSRFTKFGKNVYLIDTAGIRRKSKVHENLEFYSTIRAIKAIDEANVCILMVDAKEGLQQQDLKIFSLVERKKRGVLIVVNKWDLVKKETQTAAEFEKRIKDKLKPFNDVPVIFTSVLEKKRILKVLDKAEEVYRNKIQKIPTSKLNDLMQRAIQEHHPPAIKGKFIQIKYVTQLSGNYPLFAFFCNLPQYIKVPYRNYLENKLREAYNFEGVPIGIVFKKK